MNTHNTGFDFSGLTDLDLVRLQAEMRMVPEDKAFLEAILRELGKRQRGHVVKDDGDA